MTVPGDHEGAPVDSTPHGRVLARVRALLAKAESTTFVAEAEALTAKAQDLMTKHAINEAMLQASLGEAASTLGGTQPSRIELRIDEPYCNAKSLLLTQVAEANQSRVVWASRTQSSTLIGFDSDLEWVQILYTSLLMQATAAMVAAGPQLGRNGRSRTRSFRQAFLVAYAVRIGEILRTADEAARATAAAEYGDNLLPVLANRRDAVGEACRTAFPRLATRTIGVTNRAGWEAGTMAAELSSVTGRKVVARGRD